MESCIINRITSPLIILTLLWNTSSFAATPSLDMPTVALSGVPIDIAVSNAAPDGQLELSLAGSSGPIRHYTIAAPDGSAVFEDIVFPASGAIAVTLSGPDASEFVATGEQRVIPPWVSILPPFFAIALALAVRSVIPALALGIWFGATALISFTPSGAFRGLLRAFDKYVSGALGDSDHASIILFSMMIGGMVGIVTRSGGMVAIVNLIVSRAKSAIAGQVSIWAMGLVIFFDDYGNTLVVGNTARPLSDRLHISREKLAYIVDTTASPVACIALATTWIGYEVGLIGDSIQKLSGIDESAYLVFLHSIAYSFYPILAIIFVFAVAMSGRDFGPMVAAERRTRGVDRRARDSVESGGRDEELEPKPGVEARAINALLPIVVLVGSLFVGLYVTGEGNTFTDIIGSADSYKSLMWASLLSVVVAAALSIGQRILSVQETIDAWYAGVRAMLLAMIILILAWSLSSITADLHTADYLVSILADTLPMGLLPLTVFILSALTAFSTGTAWGTMGILMPLIIPLSWAIMQANGAADPAHMHILYSAVACNLAGAVWGDHCSPISDTTVLSSMASGCDHIEHVRTQLPYAMAVAFVAMFVGTVPTAYGFPWWLSIIVGAGVLVTLLFAIGTVTATRDEVSDGLMDTQTAVSGNS